MWTWWSLQSSSEAVMSRFTSIRCAEVIAYAPAVGNHLLVGHADRLRVVEPASTVGGPVLHRLEGAQHRLRQLAIERGGR